MRLNFGSFFSHSYSFKLDIKLKPSQTLTSDNYVNWDMTHWKALSSLFTKRSFRTFRLLEPKLVSLGFVFSQCHIRFFEQISVSLEGSKNRKSTVYV